MGQPAMRSELEGGFGLQLLGAAAIFGGFDGVAHEHGDGKFADASGNGGAGSGHAGDAGVAVSDNGAALFGELLFTLFVALEEALEEDRVGNVIDTDIEDGGSGLDEFCGDEAGTANGGDQDVATAADRRQIAGAGVADGYSGVGVGEEHGQGAADDVTASDDDRFLTFDGDVGATKDFHASGGGAGDEAGTLGAEIADVDGMEAIDILLRGDGEEDALGIDMGRQGKLDKDAIDLIAGIELLDQGNQFAGRRSHGRGDQFAENTELFAGADLAADIALRGRIVSDQNRRQTGAQAGGSELLHFLGDLGLDLGCEKSSVKHDCGHKCPPTRKGWDISSVPGLDWGCERGVDRMSEMIPAKLVKFVVCPICHGGLRFNEDFSRLRCTECGKRYRVEDGIPVLLAQEAE